MSSVPFAGVSGLLDASPDAMLAVEEDGAVIVANLLAERPFRYESGALAGTAVTGVARTHTPC
jgi:hypothetical protein